jgi:hypothetical protein
LYDGWVEGNWCLLNKNGNNNNNNNAGDGDGDGDCDDNNSTREIRHEV